MEYALHQKGVTCELRKITQDALFYELSVPFGRKIKKLTKYLEGLSGHGPISLDWKGAEEIKR